MDNVQILDVTLRELTYINSFSISVDMAKEIVNKLSSVDIDYIEIGYLRNDTNFRNFSEYCPGWYIQSLLDSIDKKSKSVLSVMLRVKDYNVLLVERLVNSGIKLVRICSTMEEIESALEIVSILKEYDILLSLNIIRASRINTVDLKNMWSLINKKQIDIFCLADSNGAMMPKQVRIDFNILNSSCGMKFGFHSHNNLGLAVTNCLTAIDSGATIIDSSILGLGKRLTNLPTEYIAILLSKLGYRKIDDSSRLIECAAMLSNEFAHQVNMNYKLSDITNLVIGANDINFDELLAIKTDGFEQYDEVNRLYLKKLLYQPLIFGNK